MGILILSRTHRGIGVVRLSRSPALSPILTFSIHSRSPVIRMGRGSSIDVNRKLEFGGVQLEPFGDGQFKK